MPNHDYKSIDYLSNKMELTNTNKTKAILGLTQHPKQGPSPSQPSVLLFLPKGKPTYSSNISSLNPPSSQPLFPFYQGPEGQDLFLLMANFSLFSRPEQQPLTLPIFSFLSKQSANLFLLSSLPFYRAKGRSPSRGSSGHSMDLAASVLASGMDDRKQLM